MAAAVAAADPDGAVPTCPDWTVRDLVRHMGGVHRWATGFVTSGRTEPQDADLDEVVGTWPADAELAGWLGQGCADLVDALAAAPDDLQCWTFLPPPSPLAMWARRQAHETAIHRVDAQLAAGAAVTGFAAPFAADGIDELLRCSSPAAAPRCAPTRRPPWRCAARTSTPPGSCAWMPMACTTTHRGDPADAACTVTGTAGALYLALWNRAGADDLTVEGDRAVLGQFSEVVRIRWS